MNESSKYPYVNHMNVKYRPLEVVDVPKLVDTCTDRWYNQSLSRVNESVVRLGIMQGKYHWHKHDDDDEFLFVLDGTFIIDLEDQSVELGPQQGFTVPKGVVHRTRSADKSAVLMVETAEILPTGEDQTIMYFQRTLALLLILVSVAGCNSAPVVETPANEAEAPVKRFLDYYFNEYRRGLPARSQFPQLASFVTPELLAQFDAALQGAACDAKRYNYEGAPAVEGDLFSSLFEGATSASYRQIARDADTATFAIEWINDDKNLSPDATTWQDRVILVKTGKGWRISDFTHDGDWDFMKDASVSQILQAVADECNAG